MRFYCLTGEYTDPSDYGDGSPNDAVEWFTSKEAALRRARKLLAGDRADAQTKAEEAADMYEWLDIDDPQVVQGKREIISMKVTRVTLADLPRGRLAFAILSGRGYVADRTDVWVGH